MSEVQKKDFFDRIRRQVKDEEEKKQPGPTIQKRFGLESTELERRFGRQPQTDRRQGK